MSKRSATPSPVEELPEAKKAKLELAQAGSTEQKAQKEPNVDDKAVDTNVLDLETHMKHFAYTLMTESILSETDPSETEDKGNDVQQATKHKSKASEGFRPWKPAAADKPIPACESHWGIIPRPGCEWPAVDQPPACTSNGAIMPPLWEDRKGGIRVKRGDRVINGYDQAYHLWLPLMNLRPKSDDQQPKREPVAYQCHHGIPVDWSDSKALTVVNKGLQNAIRDNSNKEGPYTARERECLASIFREQPFISLLEAAKIFNDRSFPLEHGINEAGVYPVGRFTESIQHEYRMYEALYSIGEAPTVATKETPGSEKNNPLEDLYAEWIKDDKETKKATKRAAEVVTTTDKTSTERSEKEHRRKKANITRAKSDKMIETADVTKTKHKSKNWKDLTEDDKAAMANRADATGRAINEGAKSEAPVHAALSSADQPHLSVNFVAAASEHSPRDLLSLSPPNTAAGDVAALPSHRIVTQTGLITESTSTVQSDSLLDSVVIDTKTAKETEPVEADQSSAKRTSSDTSAKPEVALDHIVTKAARVIEIDEEYNDDEVV